MHVDVREPLGDLAQPRHVQRVAGDVDAQVAAPSVARPRLQIQHGADDRRQQPVHDRRSVLPGYGRDRQALVAALCLPVGPVVEPGGPAEPPLPQGLRGLRGGDHRRRLRQLAARDAVEVVAVQVRQHQCVVGGELGGGQRGVRAALRREPVAQVHPLAAADEVRVGEEGEPAEPQHGGRGADEGEAGGHRWCVPPAAAGMRRRRPRTLRRQRADRPAGIPASERHPPAGRSTHLIVRQQWRAGGSGGGGAGTGAP